MSIEVNERERAVTFCVGAEKRQCQEVITTKAEQRHVVAENGFGVGLDLSGDPIGPAEIEAAVAVVDDGEPFRGIESPGPQRAPAQLGGSRSDPCRAKTRAWPVGGRQIEGDAGNGNVDTVEIPGVLAPQKAERTRIRYPGAVEGLGGKCMITVAEFHRGSQTGGGLGPGWFCPFLQDIQARMISSCLGGHEVPWPLPGSGQPPDLVPDPVSTFEEQQERSLCQEK